MLAVKVFDDKAVSECLEEMVIIFVFIVMSCPSSRHDWQTVGENPALQDFLSTRNSGQPGYETGQKHSVCIFVVDALDHWVVHLADYLLSVNSWGDSFLPCLEVCSLIKCY